MRRAVIAMMALLPVPSAASTDPRLDCRLEYDGEETVLPVPVGKDALGGVWTQAGAFRVRTLLAAPAGRPPWLLVEVHAESADGDHRIVSSQKVFAPFATGRVEVVEPGLGNSLYYECARPR